VWEAPDGQSPFQAYRKYSIVVPWYGKEFVVPVSPNGCNAIYLERITLR
jgi:hypothetical protein